MITRLRRVAVVAILMVAAFLVSSPQTASVHADTCFGGGCPQAQVTLGGLPLGLR